MLDPPGDVAERAKLSPRDRSIQRTRLQGWTDDTYPLLDDVTSTAHPFQPALVTLVPAGGGVVVDPVGNREPHRLCALGYAT